MLSSTNTFEELLNKSWQKRGGYVLRILFNRRHDAKTILQTAAHSYVPSYSFLPM
jgi:hypothetical protein